MDMFMGEGYDDPCRSLVEQWEREKEEEGKACMTQASDVVELVPEVPVPEAPVPALVFPAVFKDGVIHNLKRYGVGYGVQHPGPASFLQPTLKTLIIFNDSVFKTTPTPQDAVRERLLQQTAHHEIDRCWPFLQGTTAHPTRIPLHVPNVRDEDPSMTVLPSGHGGFCMEYIAPMQTPECKRVLTRWFSPTKTLEDPPLTEQFWEAGQRLWNGYEFRFCLRLGDIHGPDMPNPTSGMLQHFPASFKFLRENTEPVREYASMMGKALAVLHWACRLDGMGVKFILSQDRTGSCAVYLTDFGHCTDLPLPLRRPPTGDEVVDSVSRDNDLEVWATEAATRAAAAIGENLSFPRRVWDPIPPALASAQGVQEYQEYQKVWAAFELSYRDASMRVMGHSRLPPHMRELVVDRVLDLVNLTPFNQEPAQPNEAVAVVQRAAEPSPEPEPEPVPELAPEAGSDDDILSRPFNTNAALWDLWFQGVDLETDFC